MFGIFIHGLAIPKKSEHDGRWLAYYDHTKNGVHGEIRTTKDWKAALHFETQEDALKVWHASKGFRPDGRPNRPLTAFTVSVEPLPEGGPRIEVDEQDRALMDLLNREAPPEE